MIERTKWVRSIIISNEVLTINKRSESVNMCIILLRRKLKYELCTSVSFSQSDLVTAAAATSLLASCRAVPGLLSWSVIGGGSNINSCWYMLRVKPSLMVRGTINSLPDWSKKVITDNYCLKTKVIKSQIKDSYESQ